MTSLQPNACWRHIFHLNLIWRHGSAMALNSKTLFNFLFWSFHLLLPVWTIDAFNDSYKLYGFKAVYTSSVRTSLLFLQYLTFIPWIYTHLNILDQVQNFLSFHRICSFHSHCSLTLLFYLFYFLYILYNIILFLSYTPPPDHIISLPFPLHYFDRTLPTRGF